MSGVACKKLTNFYWRFPGRKRSPSFWNHSIWSSWKPSLLALRISPSVYEGVSGKLVCRTKVATPIRSLFCNTALLAAWSVGWFPHATSMLPFWCPLQCETETSVGRWTASKSLRIWSPYLIGDPLVIKWPLSFQIAACVCSTRKAYLESVYMAILFPFPISKSWVRAMSSANWAEVPGGNGLASMVSKLENATYLALLFPFKTKLPPSVYQISLGFVRDLLTIPLGVLSSGWKFLGKSKRGESPWG